MPPCLEQEDGGEHPGEDTIVVKGENHWSQPSSPESKSPEIEPLVSQLLTQINTPQKQHPQELESPEPQEEERPAATQVHKSRRARRSSHSTPKSGQRSNTLGTMEERLLQMPEVRPLPWREGVEPGAENETGGDSRRKQIRFGCLLATRGEVKDVPCLSCANGRGKFNVCVALDGYFKGACASCQLSGRPNRCSIKKNDDDEASPTTPTTLAHVEKPKSSSSKSQQQPSNEGPKVKRRKTEDKVPDWESARPVWEQELGDSQARQQMNEIVQRPWVTVNHPVSASSPQVGLNGVNGTSSNPQSATVHRNSLGWATVNQPAPQPPIQTFQNGANSKGSGYKSNVGQGKKKETILNEDGSTALIDAFPPKKQRQIYGLVSGLQGGIEHLQRELDSLKRALGIDDED